MRKSQSNFDIRHAPKRAADIINKIFPKKAERNYALRLLHNTILCANRIAPASWAVCLFPNYLRLNVGGLAVLQYYQNEIAIIVTRKMFDAIPRGARLFCNHTGMYRFVNDAMQYNFSSKYVFKYPVLRQSHLDLVERSAEKRKVCFWDYAHSPSVIKLLKRHYNTPAPDIGMVKSQLKSRNRLLDIDELDYSTFEGRRFLRKHLIRERDPKLIRLKKEIVQRRTGKLACEVCRFNFERIYGALGSAFTEVHHINPLASKHGHQKTSLSDLAIVCSNCHRMLHKGNPVFSIKELKQRLRKQ